MLEAFGAYKLYEHLSKKKEGFEEPKYGGEKQNNTDDIFGALGWFGFFFLMIFILFLFDNQETSVYEYRKIFERNIHDG